MSNQQSLPNSGNFNSSEIPLEQAQEIIYSFLFDLVKHYPPEDALVEFQNLFFNYSSQPHNLEAVNALSKIIFSKNEQEFVNTLKRCCYILINNWETKRHYFAIQKLVKSFENIDLERTVSYFLQTRLRRWLKRFLESQDYQDLMLFCAKFDSAKKEPWSHRYTSYLLISQYTDINNPKEQRKAAKQLAKKLKDQFKFDLAMYTARSQSTFAERQTPRNPTGLGEDVLRLIKMIVAKRGNFSYSNLASLFRKQVQGLSYFEFKNALQNYLIYSVTNHNLAELLKQQLAKFLASVYVEAEDEILNSSLLLRTCNRIFEFLLTENSQEPSGFFIMLMSQGQPLTLVIVLLKLILICPNSRLFLENKIAELIKYYQDYPEEECYWVVNFFEIFNITFTIYADKDVKYNLIKIGSNSSGNGSSDVYSDEEWDSYRIFSQSNGKLSQASIETAAKIAELMNSTQPSQRH
ncbi:MAG: hypothetical protein ACOC04_01485 [Halothece sp.]